MNGQTNRINTDNAGWKETCLRWAEAREPFEIEGIGEIQLPFLMQLCDTFHYELHYDSRIKNPAVVTLRPLDWLD